MSYQIAVITEKNNHVATLNVTIFKILGYLSFIGLLQKINIQNGGRKISIVSCSLGKLANNSDAPWKSPEKISLWSGSISCCKVIINRSMAFSSDRLETFI